jgi:hypothetical protein
MFVRSVVLCGAVIGLIALGNAGCGLVSSAGIQTDYSFDALMYASPTFGDSMSTATVPDIACDPSADVCATATATLGLMNASASCDPTLHKCIVKAEIRASEMIDLSKQTETQFPQQAIQFGVDVVEVKRVTYWINKNALTVATPTIEIYVAPAAAKDETDPKASLLATVAMLPAKSNVCGDPAYPAGDNDVKDGTPVCSAPLMDVGKSALGDFVKDFKTPFQIIAHTVVTAKPGDPVPAGSITFSARPTVGLKILN